MLAPSCRSCIKIKINITLFLKIYEIFTRQIFYLCQLMTSHNELELLKDFYKINHQVKLLLLELFMNFGSAKIYGWKKMIVAGF
jgi:hypothetical protein